MVVEVVVLCGLAESFEIVETSRAPVLYEILFAATPRTIAD